MRRRSQMAPQFSNRGISSSSYMSLGIFPQNTSQPAPGVLPSQPGGGPPYLRWPAHNKTTNLIMSPLAKYSIVNRGIHSSSCPRESSHNHNTSQPALGCYHLCWPAHNQLNNVPLLKYSILSCYDHFWKSAIYVQ